MKEFKIGDRVGLVSDVVRSKDPHPYCGTVDDLTSKGFVVIKWDNEWHSRKYSSPLHADLLDHEEELKKLSSSLEEEFKKVSGEVGKLIKQSAELIDQAAKLAGDKKLSYYKDAVEPLLNAMEDAGWSSSSLYC
jgi:hypothetical protein